MSAHSKNDATDRQLWEALPSDRVQAVLDAYIRRRPRSVHRAIALQFHTPSYRKVQNVHWARKHFHNFIQAMLETLREDPHQFRDNGAFECIREMMIRREETRQRGETPGKRTHVLANVIGERFRDPNKSRTSPSPRRRPPLRIIEAHDYPIIYTLRPGAERRCALMLLLFYIRSQKEPPAPAHAHAQEPDSQPDEVNPRAPFDRDLEHTSEVCDAGGNPVDDDDDYSDEATNELIDDVEEILEVNLAAMEVDGIPTIESMHQTWAQRWARYEAAARTRIPIGRNRGKPFGEALATRRMRTGQRRGRRIRRPGKRRVRWLKEQSYTVQEIQTCLAATDILLNRDRYDSESAEVLDAEQVRHLWKYEMHTHRSPRARQDAQYRASQSRQLVTLGSLSGEELHTFRDELCERLDHARQYAYIAEAIDIFLENAPPSYPTIDPGLFDDSAERKEHQNALHGLSRPVTPAAARDTDEQIGVTARPSVDEVLHRAEYDAVTRLLQAESELGARALQPLVYTRTMRPAQPLRDWTLLYKRHRPSQEELEKRYRKLPPRVRQQKINQAQEHNDGYVYRFVLAMVVHNTTPHAFTGDRPADYFAPDIREGDYSYVNFPLTPFKRPDDVSLMIFPLECGEEHQEDLLHALIERLRAEQLARYESQFTDPQQNTADHKPVEECLPRQAALGEAKIITRLNGDDRYEFFLHCAVPVITATRETPTERILGLHQHQNGYSWALIDQTGALIEAGDLHIPWHVQPRPGQSAYSDNYAFEVANQIVALAQEHNALIGIENTWTNKKVSTSADQNRRVFSHPSRKIYDQVVHKARQAGLPYPRIVYGVSPRRCGTCGNRTKNKRSKEALNACPACGSLSRAAHMQFPLASLAPMADGSAAALVLLAREQENGVRAAVITDFFYWTLRQAADVVPPPDVRQAFVAGLEQVQWRGRHIFQAKTGRDHHTYRMRQAKPNGTEQLAFRPRRLGADVIIAGPEALAPYVQEWIDAYASVAPDVRIEYVSTSRKRALAFLYRAKKDAVADVVLLDTPTSERELAAGLDKKRGWFCQDCGHHWHAEEIQFRCTYPPCRHNDLARYNTAMVVAQLTIRKLLEYNQQQSQGTPAGTADS